MKKERGVTLVTLAITITVLIIIASVATYSGIEIINSSRQTKFTAELKIMQVQINSIYQKYKENNPIVINGTTYYGEKEAGTGKLTILQIGQELSGEVQTQANKIFTELVNDGNSGITSTDTTGYRYWNVETIKSLGIEGVEQDCFVNVEKRSVISYKGLKHEGKMYYVLNQLPDNLYNVEYDNPNTGAPTFDVNYEKIGDSKWRINISNIQYAGYINKWKVQYKLEGKNYWNTSEDMSFVVNESGIYKIFLVHDNITSETKNIKLTEYVNEGILAYYDGIDNVGEGDNKHNTSTTTWKNIAGTNFKDGIIHGATIKENYLLFDGKDDWVELGEIKDKNLITLEATINLVNWTTGENTIVSNFETGGMGLTIYNGMPVMKVYINGIGYNEFILETTLEKNKIYNICGTYDGKQIKLYIDGELKGTTSVNGNIKNPENNTIMAIGCNPIRNTTSGKGFANIKVYQIRIYDRALKEKEIKQNYEANYKRFK